MRNESVSIHKNSIQMAGVHITNFDSAKPPTHQLTSANVSYTAWQFAPAETLFSV